jgi:hypothetical protein
MGEGPGEGLEKGTLADRVSHNPDAREALRVLNPAELKEAERIATLPERERARAVEELAGRVRGRGGVASGVTMLIDQITQLVIAIGS